MAAVLAKGRPFFVMYTSISMLFAGFATRFWSLVYGFARLVSNVRAEAPSNEKGPFRILQNSPFMLLVLSGLI